MSRLLRLYSEAIGVEDSSGMLTWDQFRGEFGSKTGPADLEGMWETTWFPANVTRHPLRTLRFEPKNGGDGPDDVWYKVILPSREMVPAGQMSQTNDDEEWELWYDVNEDDWYDPNNGWYRKNGYGEMWHHASPKLNPQKFSLKKGFRN